MMNKLKTIMSDANFIEAILFTSIGLGVLILEFIYGTNYAIYLKYSLAALLIGLPLPIYYFKSKNVLNPSNNKVIENTP